MKKPVAGTKSKKQQTNSPRSTHKRDNTSDEQKSQQHLYDKPKKFLKVSSL